MISLDSDRQTIQIMTAISPTPRPLPPTPTQPHPSYLELYVIQRQMARAEAKNIHRRIFSRRVGRKCAKVNRVAFQQQTAGGDRARGGFLKIVSVGIPTYAGAKTGFSRADVGLETGFRTCIGRNADWNNL